MENTIGMVLVACRAGSTMVEDGAKMISQKVARIGFLGLGPASAWSDRLGALRAGLRDLGYVEGKNILIEFRWADRIEQVAAPALQAARLPLYRQAA